MITTSSIDVLLRGVRAEFAYVIDQAGKQLAALTSNAYLDSTNKTGGLFEEINATGKQRIESIQVSGVSQLSPTAEAQEFISTDYVPVYITAVEPYKFTHRIKVTREAAERRDSKYTSALNEAAKLQIAAENTRAFHRFDRLNNAFALVTDKHLFDYNDGVALSATNHPRKDGGTAQSNRVTASDITPTTVESMILLLQNQLDDIGQPMPMGGGRNFIIVPPAKVKRAKENLDSEWLIDGAQNNINVWKSASWTLVSSPFLSLANGGSDTAWFVVDGMFSPLKDVSFRPTTNETWFDENTKVFAHDVSMEHKVGAFDWRGLVGNSGA